MKSTFSILFFIDRSKANEKWLCLIHCRISCNGKTASFSTKQQTALEAWNAQMARVKASSPTAQGINNALNAIEQGQNALYKRILREVQYITAEYLKEQFLRREKPQYQAQPSKAPTPPKVEQLVVKQGLSQKRERLPQFQEKSLQPQRFSHRKAVYISEVTIKSLDFIILRIGELGSKFSGYVERILREHTKQ